MSNINPRVDIAFKKIFGVEENKDLLISLINSIVSESDQVTDLTLLNPYNPKNFRTDKLSILDIKAQGAMGKKFNIEIQITDEADYDKRALYYWAKLYTEQLKSGEDYSKLSKAIGIHILNFTSIPKVEKYHNVFHITEKDSNLSYFKDLELHTIELKKFSDNSDEELTDIVAKIKNSLDVWVTFLTRNDLLNPDNLPKELNDAKLKKAINVLEVMNFSEQERSAYEDHLKWMMIEANTIKNYEERGEARGIEIGREEGREEGRSEGERVKAIEIAKNLLSMNLDVDVIIKATGLTKDEIEGLKSQK
jgi:predicted transposase/invertase (TIGR01784 family)